MNAQTDSALAESFSALASATRLALIRALQTPRILADIRVRSPETASDAPIARQTVSKHLSTLLAAGLVQSRDVRGERGETVEFALNHQAIYALAEEVRDLARLRPAIEPAEATVARAAGGARSDLRGPALVVVKGLDDGLTFDLTPAPPERVEWTIGRRRGLAVALDFDPFVSGENTLVRWSGGRHHVVALPGARNGTFLNFRPLPPDDPRPLRHGDLLSVGRSTLTYWNP